MSASLCAAGAVIAYLNETQKTTLAHVGSIRRRAVSDHLQIDHSTWRSLEIERTLRSGATEGSLLTAIDRTVHPIGSRTLRRWLRAPLLARDEIVRRQDAVGFLVDEDTVRLDLRRRLGVLAGQSTKAQQTGSGKKRKWWRTE